MPNKKILVIAYYFPPLGGAGVQRVLKFVKYLPEFGWEPVVLTVKEISYLARDGTLLEELSPGRKVVRTGSFDPHRIIYLVKRFFGVKNQASQNRQLAQPFSKLRFLKWLFIPDSKIGWFPLALWKGLSLIRERKIDLIFSSSPPVTAHLIGYWLSRMTKKPLVLDFRDPWNLSADTYPAALHKKLNQVLERKVLRQAKGIVAVNQFLADELRTKSLAKETEIITNGFDSADFEKLEVHSSSKFEIVYSGTFNRLNDPRPFLRAFSELVSQNQEFAEQSIFTRVGLVLDWDWTSLLREYKLGGNVNSVGYLPHRQSLEYLLKAALLLVTTTGQRGAELISTGKIYEYLAARRPILAIVPEKGAAAKLIREHQAGVVVDPGDQERIKLQLLDFFGKFKRAKLTQECSPTDIGKFERRYLTEKLALFLNQLVC